jgi:hypothetical protein
MPQLVKGGKYIFGWTTLNIDLKIRVPDEACEEYHLKENEKLVLLSGSRASGGFSIMTPSSLMDSKLSDPIIGLIGYRRETDSFSKEIFVPVRYGNSLISWTYLDTDRSFRISSELTDLLDLKAGDRLLVGRGSGLGPSFIGKGKIFKEALLHKELDHD